MPRTVTAPPWPLGTRVQSAFNHKAVGTILEYQPIRNGRGVIGYRVLVLWPGKPPTLTTLGSIRPTA